MGEAISIHALREEGDLLLGRRLLLGRISIHALREEGDTRTLPRCSSWAYFYPRPPRGGRLRSFRSLRLLGPFLSTPSARRATCGCLCQGSVRLISIHALREEGDTSKRRRSRTTCNFYPRPPRGGRQSPCVAFCVFRIFLSTPSARRATDFLLQLGICLLISIHALREEGDDYRLVRLAKFDEFLSTPSARRATAPPSLLLSASRIFLSTPSARRATQGCWRSAVE